MPPTANRRRFLATAVASAVLAALPGARAEDLRRTPRQAQGPFYPEAPPLDSDSDLTRVAGRTDVARGEITDLLGRVLDERGRPVPGARLEIWQCDANGRYHHPRDRGLRDPDPAFQGYGQTVATPDGAYRFRTIRPVPYPGRAPHIHFAVSGPGFERLVTQMYVEGAPENDGDFLLGSIHDPALRRLLVVPFRASADPQARWLAQFDLVLAADGRLRRG
jgi:protocatechuate 3,4-dioxygenase beta subunit